MEVECEARCRQRVPAGGTGYRLGNWDAVFALDHFPTLCADFLSMRADVVGRDTRYLSGAILPEKFERTYRT